MIGAAVIVGGTGHAAWAEDGQEDTLVDTKIMRHILKGLGWQRDEKGIEYRERSPLVLPGSSGKELPKPAPVSPAAKTAGWPDDPDIKRQKQRRDAEKNRKAYVEGVDDRPMLPSEYERKKGTEDKNRPATLDSKSWEESRNPSTSAGARLQKHLQQDVGQQAERICDLHRRAAAHDPDRAAARLPHAVTQPTVRRRPGKVDRTDGPSGTGPVDLSNRRRPFAGGSPSSRRRNHRAA